MFSRDDWTLFRSANTLTQKAGVPAYLLGPLVIKELADNALDAGGRVEVNIEPDGTVVVDDNGPGIPHDLIPLLFSIRRPLTTSKIVRLPTRGALGNGLRVVMGAVYASGGTLEIETGGQDEEPMAFVLKPRDDGHTDVIDAGASGKYGTRIRIRLGKDFNLGDDMDQLSKWSTTFAKFGTHYNGKTSPWWYDLESFFEMCAASGQSPTATVLALFRDISYSDAQAIVLALSLPEITENLTKTQCLTTLQTLRGVSKAPKPTVLGSIGELQRYYRAIQTGTITHGAGEILSELPFVIEAFVRPIEGDSDIITVMVNRTMVTGSMSVTRTKPSEIGIYGCGLRHSGFKVPKSKVQVILNITTPYMPITTDGKEPDLKRYLGPIGEAIKKASSKCKRETKPMLNGRTVNQKAIIESVLDEAIAKASGDGKYRYSLRQLYYAVRPHILSMATEDKRELDYNYFASVITEIEAAKGFDLPGIYRDPRGILYHPHTGEEIPLGTISIEQYKRPNWTFNKILYIEKEGFISLLRSIGWPERNDCALMSSKGFASRAARDVLDLLGDGDEELFFYGVHDADGAGTMIFQALTEATLARPGRKITVKNLGLDPGEALEMGLQVETFTKKRDGRLPVANYLKDDYENDWEEWLQDKRVELNAMTSPEFIEWLDGKFLEEVGKIVPPKPVVKDTYAAQIADSIGKHLTAKILKDAGFDDRKKAILDTVPIDPDKLTEVVVDGITEVPEARWDTPLGTHAEKIGKAAVADEVVESEEEV